MIVTCCSKEAEALLECSVISCSTSAAIGSRCQLKGSLLWNNRICSVSSLKWSLSWSELWACSVSLLLTRSLFCVFIQCPVCGCLESSTVLCSGLIDRILTLIHSHRNCWNWRFWSEWIFYRFFICTFPSSVSSLLLLLLPVTPPRVHATKLLSLSLPFFFFFFFHLNTRIGCISSKNHIFKQNRNTIFTYLHHGQ